jgi:hypothetical protein
MAGTVGWVLGGTVAAQPASREEISKEKKVDKRVGYME